jgi:hypothetical protein
MGKRLAFEVDKIEGICETIEVLLETKFGSKRSSARKVSR